MKRSILILSLFAQSIALIAQSGYLVDGLRFSENIYGSTARFSGIGAAGSSLGGDFGSISINPAGIGVYRGSEFVITPGFSALSSVSNFAGNKKDDIGYSFNFNNVGLVLNFKGYEGEWEYFSLTFGYNKLNDYDRNYKISGISNTSMANYFANNVNGYGLNELDDYWEGLAFDAYIIDTVPGSGGKNYFSPFPNSNYTDHKNEVRGSLGEYSFGFGTNYNNIVYLGASLNARSGFYEESIVHKESSLTNLDNYTFSRYINSYHKGFNAKFGIIVRPIESLRVGVSLFTPTVGTVNMNLNSKASANSLANGVNSAEPEISDIDKFSVSSPFRFVTGVSYLVGQIGLISADYEFTDYRAMHFSDGYYSSGLNDANDDTKTYFKSTHNFRLGTELRFNELYCRGGFAYYASPYEGQKNNSNVYSGGIGYRKQTFFIDASYSLYTNTSYYKLYDSPDVAQTSLKANVSKYLLTVGFRF